MNILDLAIAIVVFVAMSGAWRLGANGTTQ